MTYTLTAQRGGLHRSTSGVDETRYDSGPWSCAKEMARYISDASTVRIRTLDRWGRSPPVDAIRGMIQARKDERTAFKGISDRLGENKDDARNFAFFGQRPNNGPRVKPAPRPKPEALAPLPEPTPQKTFALPAEIIAEIARVKRISPGDITGKSRLSHYLPARNLTAHVLRHRGWNLPAIGRIMGGRDHSTIVNSLRRFEERASLEERALAARLIGAVG